ncbi:uncharacterized protein LOC102362489 isoform X2 [Latimeria chalumnae]|uniref:uncharacterized protein LOC102362489 isoform X2 n=1 Tax=Latimeria chalumnae TaxID=7897 RepID=UPI0003C16328|nr:PREDICTED: uncharacterized protein LOC102362489 isoform X2 [Latimeria chalumnae]|eukprot:XP_014343115.1 PREDICTED: uncharacterized protein LOC102362489 isoform X2 [Latimeria chalumnae]
MLIPPQMLVTWYKQGGFLVVACLGPPKLSLLSKSQSIEVNLTMPFLPKKRNSNHTKTIFHAYSDLIYNIVLFKEGKREQDQRVTGKDGNSIYVFEHLMLNTNYCVEAQIYRLNSECRPSVILCTRIQDDIREYLWIVPLVIVLVMVMLAFGIVMQTLILNLFSSSIPKTLTILSEDLHINLNYKMKEYNQEEDHISFLSVSDLEEAETKNRVQLLPENDAVDAEESVCYHRNEFGLGHQDNEAYSRSSTETDILEDRQTEDNSGFSESLKDCYSKNIDYENGLKPEIPLSAKLNSELDSGLLETISFPNYDKAQYAGTRGYDGGSLNYTENMKNNVVGVTWESIMDVQCNIPLSSVKLAAIEELALKYSDFDDKDIDITEERSTGSLCRNSNEVIDCCEYNTNDLHDYGPLNQETFQSSKRTGMDDPGYESYPKIGSSECVPASGYETRQALPNFKCTSRELGLET